MAIPPEPPRAAAVPVAIVIPVLDEAAILPRLRSHLDLLDPAPAEVLLVDSGDAAASPDGFTVIQGGRGRARAINAGVAAIRSPLVCVLHADTFLPDDAIAVIRRVMADPAIALAGFTPVISGPEKVRWATTAHNWLKTWYAPLLFRPAMFWRGGRLLFGDHAMFFRRADYLAVGGCDETLTVMEDADLCIRLSRRGRVRLVNRIVLTSDRRVARWGEWRANWIYLSVGVRWGLGRRKQLAKDYPDVR